jgi:hypothetical protein
LHSLATLAAREFVHDKKPGGMREPRLSTVAQTDYKFCDNHMLHFDE